MSNLGRSKRGISNLGVSLGVKPAVLAFALVDTLVTFDIVMVLSRDGFPDSLTVGFAGDFSGGRFCTSGSAATPTINRSAADGQGLTLLRPVSHYITSFILRCNINDAAHKSHLCDDI